MRAAMFRARVETENIGGVLHDKKKRAVIFIVLARIAPANRSSEFKKLYIRQEAKCMKQKRKRKGGWKYIATIIVIFLNCSRNAICKIK